MTTITNQDPGDQQEYVNRWPSRNNAPSRHQDYPEIRMRCNPEDDE